ncbi:MAG: carbohydrate-binding domain-containing protein [Clostridia bacterium]
MNNKIKNDRILKIFISLLVLILIGFLVIIYFYQNSDNQILEYVPIDTEATNLTVEYKTEELTGEWSEYVAKVNLSDSKTIIEGKGVTATENIITINSAGTYYITGSISDGNIIIEANKNDEVQIVLDNASITSKYTAPINAKECSKLTITLADNSENTITDSETCTIFTDTEKSEPDGTIFTKTDLVINGNGKLIVNANYLDGIVSKDGLKIINSNIKINAKDDGIRGKDYVAINNANIDITSKGDGIKSTNTEDTELGYIALEGGTININSESDGIQAETILNISSSATINITTIGEVASSNNINNGFNRGGYKGEYITQNSSTTEDSKSSKGLKAGSEITINNGNIEINSTDDSIHSNGIIVINNGTIKVSSGDDGIHADTNIAINGGNINIIKSYEGIESAYIEIDGGTISVVSSDDGINVAGGNDSSSMSGRQGQNSFSQVQSSDRKLVINNGDLFVNASGDGLDSNGSMYINGGNITVAGPTSTGNGALDYDGECIITGGNLIVYGSYGMWQNPSSTSTQYVLTFQTSGNSGDLVSLKNNSGTEITSFKTEKAYGGITISNANIKKGNTYTLYVNGTSVGSLEANSIITSNASSAGREMQPNKGEKPRIGF